MLSKAALLLNYKLYEEGNVSINMFTNIVLEYNKCLVFTKFSKSLVI